MEIHYSSMLSEISYACQHLLSWDGFDNEKDIPENLYNFIALKIPHKSPIKRV